MTSEQVFDYYYGDESEQFSFVRIPRQLMFGAAYKKLSNDAKLLYALFLDRMSLSARNGWYDEQGRVYIYYTLEQIQADLNCGHEKAVKLLAELDGKKGIGLIERVKQGLGRPTMIYVKKFTVGQPTLQGTEEPDEPNEQDLGKEEVRLPKTPSFGVRKNRVLDLGKPNGNKTDKNYTELNQTDLSINPPNSVPWIDRFDCRRKVEENLEYPLLCTQFGEQSVNEVVELLTDTLCSTRPTLRIGGEEVPAKQVRSRLWGLRSQHLEYVFDCLSKNTTEIRNIRGYLLATLYNAPLTIHHFYRSEVNHDLGL